MGEFYAQSKIVVSLSEIRSLAWITKQDKMWLLGEGMEKMVISGMYSQDYYDQINERSVWKRLAIKYGLDESDNVIL